jgi:hypothetical protein
MRAQRASKRPSALWAAALGAVGAVGAAAGAPAAAEPSIVALTQVPCQFLEAEGVDRGYRSRSAADCEAINARTGAQRVAEAKVLVLGPGRYLFRVTNRNVPYELGFWLRGATLVSRATLPSVSGGGILPGGSRDYEVELKPGEYVYSCPLNPTPDYRLIVR